MQRRGLSDTAGRQAQPEQARGGAAIAAAPAQLTRRRGTAGGAGSGLSGAAGRLAAPLRGRRTAGVGTAGSTALSRRRTASRRGDGRAARMAASGGRTRLCARVRVKKRALLEQIIVDGSLCSKPGQGQRRRPGSMGHDHPLPCHRLSAYRRHTVRAATEPSAPSEGELAEISSCHCQHCVRMRQPQPNSVMMRARRVIDVMTGAELPAATAESLPQSVEALSLADEAGGILTSKCLVQIYQIYL